MKKSLIMLTFLLLVALLSATQGTIKLNSDPNAAQLVRSSETGLTIRYNVSALDYNEVLTSAGSFTALTIRDFSTTNKTGLPSLPLIRQLISVPEAATVDFEITRASRQALKLSDYNLDRPILPRQESVSKSADPASIQFVMDRDFYTSRNWTANSVIAIEEIGYMRGERLFAVDFAPVRYNPSTGELEVVASAEVNISFVGGDLAATRALKNRTYSPAFSSVFANTVLNYNPGNDRSTLNRYPMSYVIITPANMESTLAPFVEWKTKEGYNVIVANLTTIGSTTNAIKTYLQGLWNNATETNPAPSYVLFVGDTGQLPSNNGQTSGGHITDLTYVRLQGTDYVPEMYYGRFSATTTADLTVQINKTLMHEMYTMPSDTYLADAVMIAGVDASWSPTHANGQINYGTNNYFNAAHGITSHTYLYPASGNSESQIYANINQGVGYVNYTAHGSETSWADPSFTIANINALTNVNEYPVIVGNCCLTNAFDTGTCFGEALLRAVNKGAVAYIGGTNSTYWDEDYYWGVGYKPPAVGSGSPFIANRTGAYDAVFHDHNEPFADWASTTGSMIFMGNMAVVAANSTRINYYWEIYSVMGDPSLGIYMGIPPVNNANVTPTSFIGLTSMDMTVDPYTYAALSMNGVLHGVGLADANGNLSLTYSAFEAPGTAQLVLTRSLKRPTIINIDVVPNAGPYVMVNAVTVNDGNNATAEAGETVGLDLSFNNVGIQDASNLVATISTPSSYVTFANTTVTVPNIAAGATSVLANAFSMAISPFIPDQTVVELAISITDGTNTWISNRTVTVSAPNVQIAGVTFVDADGDGFNEAGENVTVTVNISNTGHMVSEGGRLDLLLAFANATLNNNSFTMPGIPIGQNIPMSFVISLGAGIADGTVIPLGIAYTAGNQMINHTVMIPVGVIGEGFESNNFNSFPWVNNSSAPWTIVSGETTVHSGNYAAKSGTITHNGSTSLQLTLDVGAAGNISFWRKVSSESNYDFLKFAIDNVDQGSWSGTQDWALATYPVTTGNHTFKWTYSKDVSYSSGSDCAWIDEITFPTSGSGSAAILYVPTENIEFLNVAANTTVSADFAVRNLGNVSLSGMISIPDAFELKMNGQTLPDDYNYNLAAGTSQIFSIAYTTGTTGVQINDVITVSSNDSFNPVQQITLVLTTAVANDDETGAPLLTKLDGNYPNPFNPETSIRYSVKEPGRVRIGVYNLKGQLVKTLVDGSLNAGKYKVIWNGLDASGRGVASGVYLYRMESPGYTKTLKMMLMK